jgi:antitoxin ParD1/3/4
MLKPEHKLRIEALRHSVVLGAEQIQKGQVTDGEIVFAKLQEKISQISQPET